MGRGSTDVSARCRARTRTAAAAAVAAMAVLALACTEGETPSSPRSTSTTGREVPSREVVVTSITDGDTFRAGTERIRLIGIDTPEVAQGPECGGPEATAALERLIPVGTEVLLLSDEEPTDRYDRTLAYVHRASDDLDVGLALLEEGRARTLEVAPNLARAASYRDASDEARAAGRGVWGECPDPAAPSAPPPSSPTPSSAAETTLPADDGSDGTDTADDRPGCDPSYPDVCIPPSPPDLDCSDIPYRRFRVLPPDPHRFDDASGAGDGVGCERD